jgi:hypothetical protein
MRPIVILIAVLHLHAASQQVFVVWQLMGEIEIRIYLHDSDLWPPEVMAVLREKAAIGD